MATFQVQTPHGIISVDAPDDASDDQIIELAKAKEVNMANQAAAAPATGPIAPEGMPDDGQIKARVLGAAGGGANVMRGAIPSVGTVVNAVRGTTSATPATAASMAGNVARRFVGPYGAITSAADVERRLAEGNYGQAAISGIGAAGYGMSSLGNIFPPAKIPGMVVGGAADVANMGIDAIREQIRRMALEKAQREQGNYTAP